MLRCRSQIAEPQRKGTRCFSEKQSFSSQKHCLDLCTGLPEKVMLLAGQFGKAAGKVAAGSQASLRLSDQRLSSAGFDAKLTRKQCQR